MSQRELNDDALLTRAQIRARLGGISRETFRKYRNEGRIPAPDVDFSAKSKWWKVSSLRASGLNI